MPETWKNCSVCKKPIPAGGKWFKCSVSTCNSSRLQLVFCSMACWDAHVPGQNHRSGVWATEERAPLDAPVRAPEARHPEVRAHDEGRALDVRRSDTRVSDPRAAEPERRLVRTPGTSPQRAEEILIIASRLKEHIREEADFNVAADVMEALSDLVREATVQAIRNARADGRRTVMARDYGR